MKNWVKKFLLFILSAISIILLHKLFYNEFNKHTVSSAILISLFLVIFLDTLFLKWMVKIARWQEPKILASIPDVELKHDEQVIKMVDASHLKSWEAVGGKLTLTNKRLVFQSHKLNIQRHRDEFAVEDIIEAAVDDKKREKVFRLVLKNNEVHHFVVDSPSEWIALLNRA
jgi:hypothetical protein